MGVRFVFCGDAGKDEEKKVVDNFNVGFYKACFESVGVDVNLHDVDFLMVSSHGASSASGIEFVSLLKPKNVVVSVSGDNLLGLPSNSVLEGIQAVNEFCSIWRTDVYGTIVATVSKLGEIKMHTQIR
jgi:beta-lactamase superfamily II metal-dependent hydrolase